MSIDRGLPAIGEATPGRGEPGPRARDALRTSETTHGIADAVADEEGRRAGHPARRPGRPRAAVLTAR